MGRKSNPRRRVRAFAELDRGERWRDLRDVDHHRNHGFEIKEAITTAKEGADPPIIASVTFTTRDDRTLLGVTRQRSRIACCGRRGRDPGVNCSGRTFAITAHSQTDARNRMQVLGEAEHGRWRARSVDESVSPPMRNISAITLLFHRSRCKHRWRLLRHNLAYRCDEKNLSTSSIVVTEISAPARG